MSQKLEIQFDTIDVALPKGLGKTGEWLLFAIAAEGYELGDLGIYFCSDNELHQMNVEHLNHDTLTDIITFDFVQAKTVSGELYISIDRVLENAQTFAVSFDHELHRVIVHGVLHLLGYGDKTEDEKKKMRAKENFYLGQRT